MEGGGDDPGGGEGQGGGAEGSQGRGGRGGHDVEDRHDHAVEDGHYHIDSTFKDGDNDRNRFSLLPPEDLIMADNKK